MQVDLEQGPNVNLGTDRILNSQFPIQFGRNLEFKECAVYFLSVLVVLRVKKDTVLNFLVLSKCDSLFR